MSTKSAPGSPGGQGHFVKSWKKRWFWLHGQMITYYEHPEKTKEVPKGKIFVRNAVVELRVSDSSTPYKNNIAITQPLDGTFLLFGSPNYDEMLEWYRKILEAANGEHLFDGQPTELKPPVSEWLRQASDHFSISPNGSLIAFSCKGSVRLFCHLDTLTCGSYNDLSRSNDTEEPLRLTFPDVINSISWTKNSDQIVTGHANKYFSVVRVSDLSVVKTVRTAGEGLRGWTLPWKSECYLTAEDSKGPLRVWNIDTGQLLTDSLHHKTCDGLHVSVSQHSVMYATCQEATIALFRGPVVMPTLKAVSSNCTELSCITINGMGTQVAVAGNSNVVEVYETRTMSLLLSLTIAPPTGQRHMNIDSLQFSHGSGEFLAIGMGHGQRVLVYSVNCTSNFPHVEAKCCLSSGEEVVGGEDAQEATFAPQFEWSPRGGELLVGSPGRVIKYMSVPRAEESEAYGSYRRKSAVLDDEPSFS